MPSDRLLRFSVAGMMLFVSLIFFYSLFGGDLASIHAKYLADRNFVTFIGLLLATPVLGIICSTICYVILTQWVGYKLFYQPPMEPFVVAAILEANSALKEEIINKTDKDHGIEEKVEWKKSTTQKFFTYHQAYVKQHITNERLSFLERRWSAFWVLTNSIFALLLSAFLCFLHRFITTGFSDFTVSRSYLKWSILCILFVFALAAWYQLKNTWSEAREVESILLSKAVKDADAKAQSTGDKKLS